MIQYSSLNDAWGNSNKEIYKKIINKDINNIDSLVSTSTSPTNMIKQDKEIVIQEDKPHIIQEDKANLIQHIISSDIKIEKMLDSCKTDEIVNSCNINNNYIQNHITTCKPCRDKLKLLFKNDNIKINKNILQIIFVLLIFIILLILISLCKKIFNNTDTIKYNNKYYNDFFFESYLRHMLNNKNL